MAVPTTKAELLSAISLSFDRLIADLARVPLERRQEASLDGHAAGTLMSPSDLVAYLIGWNELVLKWLDQDDIGEAIEFPEIGYKWNQLGQLAQKFYTDYAALGWSERLERLTNAKERLVETLLNRSDDELYGRGWYRKWTKGRMVQFNTSSPYANARTRIRKWLRDESG